MASTEDGFTIYYSIVKSTQLFKIIAFGAGFRAGGFYPFGDRTGPKMFSSTTLIFKAVPGQVGYLANFFAGYPLSSQAKYRISGKLYTKK